MNMSAAASTRFPSGTVWEKGCEWQVIFVALTSECDASTIF